MKVPIFFMLVIGILISGCISSSTNDTGQISATPEPATGVSVTAMPLPSANATPAASTAPAATATINASARSVNTSPGFDHNLPPAIFFTKVPALGSSDKLKGTVGGVDPTDYRLAIFVNAYGWYNAPSASEPLTAIGSDGTWECDITANGEGLDATEIDAFLVPADFSTPIVYGRYGLPGELKGSAIACNGVNRK